MKTLKSLACVVLVAALSFGAGATAAKNCPSVARYLGGCSCQCSCKCGDCGCGCVGKCCKSGCCPK
jgi:hypothetical protein